MFISHINIKVFNDNIKYHILSGLELRAQRKR